MASSSLSVAVVRRTYLLCRWICSLEARARAVAAIRDAEDRTRFLGLQHLEYFKLFVWTCFGGDLLRIGRGALRPPGGDHQPRASCSPPTRIEMAIWVAWAAAEP